MKPISVQVGCGLDVMDAGAMAAAGGDEFMRVVAVRAADDDDDVTLLRELDGGVLAQFGRLADGVHEADFRFGKALDEEPDELTHFVDGLRGLGDDAEAGAFGERMNILLAQDDIELREIFRHAADFHVVALADDDGVKTFTHQFRETAMSDLNERAGGFENVQTAAARLAHDVFGRTVGGDHHCGSFNRAGLLRELDSPGAQVGEDSFVVDEVAKDGKWFALGGFERQRNGVFDAKTHAQMFCTDDIHFAIQSN